MHTNKKAQSIFEYIIMFVAIALALVSMRGLFSDLGRATVDKINEITMEADLR